MTETERMKPVDNLRVELVLLTADEAHRLQAHPNWRDVFGRACRLLWRFGIIVLGGLFVAIVGALIIACSHGLWAAVQAWPALIVLWCIACTAILVLALRDGVSGSAQRRRARAAALSAGKKVRISARCEEAWRGSVHKDGPVLFIPVGMGRLLVLRERDIADDGHPGPQLHRDIEVCCLPISLEVIAIRQRGERVSIHDMPEQRILNGPRSWETGRILALGGDVMDAAMNHGLVQVDSIDPQDPDYPLLARVAAV